MKQLMIVESPNKVKSVAAALKGTGIKVMASIGHVRGLNTQLKDAGAVEPNNGFKMHYVLNSKNKQNTQELLKYAKGCDIIYLATDLDYEGTAIAWHLRELISKDNKDCEFRRVTYNAVNEKAIKEAVANYTQLDMNLVQAQFTRQALDYLVGFHVSPLLWKMITPGLSAGRVQSPTLRLLSEREREIQNFKPVTFWEMKLLLNKDSIDFTGRLIDIGGTKIEKHSLTDKAYKDEHEQAIQSLLKNQKSIKVADVNSSKVHRKPRPPYTTSTLQVDAVRKFGWSATRVMTAAQKLFEGNGGEHGFITYHRTDSVMLSEEALGQIHSHGRQHYPDAILEAPRRYKGHSKSAQEAHEAIRPTEIWQTPDKLKGVLSGDEYKLYELIWQRTMACQMKDAIFDATRADFKLGNIYTFRSTGSVLVFKGYLEVYKEGKDIDKESEDDARLPSLIRGDAVGIKGFECTESETKPPARYNEASIVKALEKYGIGRPSTYASIIRTLKERLYVEVESNRIKVTDVGLAVSDYLCEQFAEYVDYQFTARLEDQMDEVAKGNLGWVMVMTQFWKPFKQKVDEEKLNIKGRGVGKETDHVCEKCCKVNYQEHLGKYGKFLKCPGCGHSKSLSPKKELTYIEGLACPNCGGRIALRTGYKGSKFGSCENFRGNEPGSCRYRCQKDGTPIPEAEVIESDVKCHKCKKEKLVARKSKWGNWYWACRNFKCKTFINKKDYEQYGLDKIELPS